MRLHFYNKWKDIEIVTNREILCDMGYESSVIFENPSYDSAIIGISEDERVIYDYDKMIKYLVTEDDMTIEEASDFISYNTIRSLPYIENHPIIMYNLIYWINYPYIYSWGYFFLCKIAKTASLLEKELEEKMPVIENYNKVKILKRF